MTEPTASTERLDLLEALGAHRHFLRQTAAGLTDDQARHRSTASSLSIGGLIKHVTSTEQGWAQFMVDGGGAGADHGIDWSDPDPSVLEAYQAEFRMVDGETLQDVLDRYEAVAAETDRLVRELPDLDRAFTLPPAPWFPPGARRSVRRAIVHVIAETAQHAGHADIIRESIDGAKTMG